MRGNEIIQTDDLLSRISCLVNHITESEAGKTIYLKNVVYNSRSLKTGGGATSVNCIFLNEERNLCADLYRLGSGGFFDFICGRVIDDLEECGLEVIVSALECGNWSVDASGYVDTKEKKRALSFPKIPFFQKGA